MPIRQGKEHYAQLYEKAMQLQNQGKSIASIAKELNLAYSCVYNWLKEQIKPKPGMLTEMSAFLGKNGPQPLSKLEQHFPSHDDAFQQAKIRGIQIKRYKTSAIKTLGKNATWYYLPGQEQELKERVLNTLKRYKDLKENIINRDLNERKGRKRQSIAPQNF
jgi:hypothetical protein